MFKNRAFQVKMVRDSDEFATPTINIPKIDMDKAEARIRVYAKEIAIGGVAVYAAVKAIDTLSTVIINGAPKR